MKEDGYLIWCGDDDLSSGQRRYTKRAQREADDVADMEGYSSATHIGQFEGFLVFEANGEPIRKRDSNIILVDEDNYAYWADDSDFWYSRLNEILDYCRTHKPRKSKIKGEK